MQCLLKLLAFACCVISVAPWCSYSKYNQGPRDWLRCSGSNIEELKSKLQPNFIAITISQSVIPEIPDLTFIRNATTLENLNFHDCGISRIGNQAFRGLSLLKKLSLAYNNITKLNASWFYDLALLEQLDVSFNKISSLDSSIYFQLKNLQRLDLNDNFLTCIPKENMGNMMQLKNIRIQENPLTHTCRAQITLWLKDHKISYATSDDNFVWSDSILWDCLLDVPTTPGASTEVNTKMNICVISKMFNQLTTVLGGTALTENSTRECGSFRQSLTQCLKSRGVTKNGDVLMNVLALAQNEAKLGPN